MYYYYYYDCYKNAITGALCQMCQLLFRPFALLAQKHYGLQIQNIYGVSLPTWNETYMLYKADAYVHIYRLNIL